MGGPVFVSWALWEKLTFILAVCIGAVFLAGLAKLWWMARYAKKHELIDLERKAKEREMRESGIWIEPKSKGSDIPFGVRAIESGIEVDGIWISSKGTQPLPARIKTVRTRQPAGSSSSSTESEQSGLPRGRQPVPRSTSLNSAFDKAVGAEALSSPESYIPQHRRAGYKPRQSSQLRFSSYMEGQFDQDTLGALEGNSILSKHHDCRLGQRFESSPSLNSAADNERSSEYESEDTFAHFNSTSDEPVSNIGDRRKAQQGTADYFSVPRDESPHEKTNPFVTPNQSPLAPAAMNDEQAIADSELPLLQDSYPAPTGNLTANRSVRKVNSGFEVLPAGTFETSRDMKGKSIDREEFLETPKKEKHWSYKLTRKARNSTSISRSSSFLERI